MKKILLVLAAIVCFVYTSFCLFGCVDIIDGIRYQWNESPYMHITADRPALALMVMLMLMSFTATVFCMTGYAKVKHREEELFDAQMTKAFLAEQRKRMKAELQQLDAECQLNALETETAE